METKREIRDQLKKIRNNMEDTEWQHATESITARVVQSDWFREATDIFCYMNIGSEVGTLGIIEEAWRLGKDVWLPKVSGTDMEFYLIRSVTELCKGTFGVMEPTGESEKAEGTDGLMIVPGIAFDRELHRIGYGKGYYDRYISRHPELITMGISFNVQLLEKIPAEEQDQKLDILITETLVSGGSEDE